MSTDPSDVDVEQIERSVADLREAGFDELADGFDAAAERAREREADE